jgi:hypothetical protein
MFLLLIDVFFLFVQDGIDKPQKYQNVCCHPTHQQQSDFLILVLYDFIVQSILSSFLLLCYNLMIIWIHCTFDRNKKFSSASKVVLLLFAQRFITIFNCRYHTSNHLSVCLFLPHDIPPTKKSSTIKSWPTFCDQYFWKFPIWNSRADEKRREIRMVKVFKWYPVTCGR